MNLTEVDIQNDAERLFSIASENKIGKIDYGKCTFVFNLY